MRKEGIYTLFETLSSNLTMSQKSITHETCITTKKRLKINNLVSFRDPAGTRTQDPNIKSVVLYRLSY